jgi:energy-coupling factor transporter transmembrane protein EcfT
MPSGWFFFIYMLLIVAAVCSAKECLRLWLRFAVKIVLPTTVMLVIVYGFLVPFHEGAVLVTVTGIHISVSGVLIAVVITGRLLMVGGITILFFTTTPLMEFAHGLRALKLPEQLVAVFVSSFNMHRVVIRKIRQITDAQKSRGLYSKGFIVGRLRMYIPILRPLVFGMLLSATERSSLWQSRGYLRVMDKEICPLKLHDFITILLATLIALWAGLLRWLA